VAITIQQLAEHRLGRSATNMGDYYDVGLDMLGGCQRCGASIAAYNAYPSKSGYWRCEDCIGDDGYETVQEANKAIFEEVTSSG